MCVHTFISNIVAFSELVSRAVSCVTKTVVSVDVQLCGREGQGRAYVVQGELVCVWSDWWLSRVLLVNTFWSYPTSEYNSLMDIWDNSGASM